MNSQNERCPLCGNPPTNYEAGHPTDFVDCRTCGRFRIFDTLDTLKIPADLRPYLSAATRQATGRGELIAISDKNAKELAEPHQRTTVTEKVQKVLYLIAEKTKSPGTDCTIDWLTDYPLIDARNSGELMSYLGHLKENRLADQNASDTARMVGRSTDGALLTLLASHLQIDRPLKWDADLEARMQALTVDQVNAAFRKHIDPTGLSIVKAGDFKAAGVFQ